MTKEGSQSMEIKNFLLKQPEVENVSIDNRVYTPASGDQPLHPGDKCLIMTPHTLLNASQHLFAVLGNSVLLC